MSGGDQAKGKSVNIRNSTELLYSLAKRSTVGSFVNLTTWNVLHPSGINTVKMLSSQHTHKLEAKIWGAELQVNDTNHPHTHHLQTAYTHLPRSPQRGQRWQRWHGLIRCCGGCGVGMWRQVLGRRGKMSQVREDGGRGRRVGRQEDMSLWRREGVTAAPCQR